ncbi:MAG TPA: ATP-binding protein, partial [Nocardioides sp.]
MIRNIRIRQWRAYDDATIDLDYPVVFFVAENGVGKSSFFEAARCCLLGFPNGRAAARAVRANADRAELSMELALGDDDIINVTRTLTRTGRATFSASRNGVTLDENTYLSTLQTTWAADNPLIDRLMFGDPGASRSNAPLPIRDHLAELLGVTPMLDAAATLRLAQAGAHSRVATVREAANASADEAAVREAAVDDAREVLSAIVAERDAAR